MIEIICEIGKNFVVTKDPQPLEFLLENAKTLIREAKKAGADTVKFQCHSIEDECHPDSKITSPHFDQDRYEWVKRNTYPVEFWMEIADYCRELEVEFLCTPMSRGAAILLDVLGVRRWKIGSGDILDFVMLDYIRQSGKPVILSSGMSSLEELKLAYNYLAEKVKDITILHCVSIYPCPLDKLNISTITFLKKEFPRAKIGFSSHCLDIAGSLMAVNLGAVLVEAHFTLDRDAFGADHKVSLLPYEMEALVYRIKNNALIIPTNNVKGVETKFINEEEVKFRAIFRKGLYAGVDKKAGELWMADDIISLRPKGEARRSELYPAILNTIAIKDYTKGEAIKNALDEEDCICPKGMKNGENGFYHFVPIDCVMIKKEIKKRKKERNI